MVMPYTSIACRVVEAIWVVLSQLWASLTGMVLSPLNEFSLKVIELYFPPSHEVLFDYLRYWDIGAQEMGYPLMDFVEYHNKYIGSMET